MIDHQESLINNRKEPIFHVDSSKYTSGDIGDIIEFFNDCKTYFSLKQNDRDGAMLFEEFPLISKREEWEELIRKLAPKLLEECHPLLRRRDFRVRFVKDLVDPDRPDAIVGADCLDITSNSKSYYLIRLRMVLGPEDENTVPQQVFNVLHEIAETDYWLKTTSNKVDDKSLNPSSLEYLKLEDETVANRRVLRLMKEVYPEISMDDIDYEAEFEPESKHEV